MSGRGLPAAYSWDAAFALVAGYTPSRVIEKKLRSTLAFWARYESVTLPTPLTLENVKVYARAFRRHLGNPKRGELDMTPAEANAAALAAFREWWTEYCHLCDLM